MRSNWRLSVQLTIAVSATVLTLVECNRDFARSVRLRDEVYRVADACEHAEHAAQPERKLAKRFGRASSVHAFSMHELARAF